eukprot:7182908-Prymnesium_polylepis.1
MLSQATAATKVPTAAVPLPSERPSTSRSSPAPTSSFMVAGHTRRSAVASPHDKVSPSQPLRQLLCWLPAYDRRDAL